MQDHTQINRGRQTGNDDKFDFVKLISKQRNLPQKEAGSSHHYSQLSVPVACFTHRKGQPESWPSTFLQTPCIPPLLDQPLDTAPTFSSFTTDTSPLTMPVINSTAGITCATTISAQNPKNTQTKIPLLSSLNPDAANAVTGAKVPTIVVISALLTSSYFKCC